MARLLAGQGVERTDTAKNGTGTTGALTGASQSLVAANKDRVGLFVSNTSAANKMYLSLGGTASNGSGVMVPPNTTLSIPGYSGAVAVIGTAADVMAFAEI